jgi:hypothetical protein
MPIKGHGLKGKAKQVTILLDGKTAKWVEGLKQVTGLSEEEVVKGSLEILRVAVSTEEGRICLRFALKAAGLRIPDLPAYLPSPSSKTKFLH